MAGITTPFTAPVFPFLQTVSQRTLDNIIPAFTLAAGPSVAPIPLTPDGRPRPGRVLRRSRPRLGLRSAVERARCSASCRQHLRRAGVRRLEDHPRRLPDTNLNQLTVEQLAQGPSLQQRVQNPYFGIDPTLVFSRRPDDYGRAALKPYPHLHDRQPLSQQRRHDDLSRLLRQARAALLARPLVSRQLYALEARWTMPRRCSTRRS